MNVSSSPTKFLSSLQGMASERDTRSPAMARLRRHPAADPENARAREASDLVRRKAQKICAERADIDRDLSPRLCGVEMQLSAQFLHGLGKLLDSRDDAGLVVDPDHADKSRL